MLPRHKFNLLLLYLLASNGKRCGFLSWQFNRGGWHVHIKAGFKPKQLNKEIRFTSSYNINKAPDPD